YVQGDRVSGHSFLEKDYQGGIPGAEILKSQVKTDSRAAFLIADREARNAKVGFDSINYELRCRELSREPIWSLDLRSLNDVMVGRVYVSAKDGAVLRRVWLHPEAPKGKATVAKHGSGGGFFDSMKEGWGKLTEKSNATPAKATSETATVTPVAPAQRTYSYGD
ncbi:MAG: hypothetical protein ACC661_07535, partial [Verrucomicrobiales bacterium]